MKYMFELALQHEGPLAIRYQRGKIESSFDGSIAVSSGLPVPFKLGESEIIKEGKDLAIIALGSTVSSSLSAAIKLEKEGISVMVVNARFVKPLDRNLIASVASMVPKIITVEENSLQGGFGSAVLELLNEMELSNVKVRRIGVPDMFIEQGNQSELRRKYGLDEDGIHMAVLSFHKEPTFSF
jgi:1-deoxy-D-xylulose-5-phosphate synthase